MKKCLALMAILLLVMAFGVTGAFAEPEGHHEGMKEGGGMMMHEMGEHHIRMMLMQLGLDDKQKEQIEVIITRTKKDMIKKKADIEIAEIDLKNILSKDPVDMKAAESKIREIGDLKTAMKLTHFKAIEEGKAVLTAEQRAKMKKMMQMHMMGGGMMCGMKEGGCGCGMKEGGCNCDMMKGGTMKGMEHHDHEKMMMK